VDYKLRLEEFKILFSRLKRGIPWVDHLLLGFLWWLEEMFLEARIQLEVSKAIEEYEQIDSPVVSLPQPVYSEKPSETSTSLPEMRLTAPWYKERGE
jgi:cytoskeletal protein RodZ